jgi:hypothetical protein
VELDLFPTQFGTEIIFKNNEPRGFSHLKNQLPHWNTSKLTLNGTGTGTSAGWLLSFDRGYQPGYQVGY